MIQLVLYLLLGAALFASLLLMALRRRARAEGSAEAIAEAQQALGALRSSLLPSELVQRIFAREDFDFVAAEAPEAVGKVFRAERKRISLLWVRQVGSAVVRLRRFYLGRARQFAQLDFRTEVELAVDFALLVLVCHALELLLYLGGPYAAPRMVGATARAATRVCDISDRALAFLNPPALALAGNHIGWGGR